MEKKSNILSEEVILKEYKINDYMTLKLIGKGDYRKTHIFVNNYKFLQCMYILLNIDKDNLSSTEEIDSIDEAVEKLDHSLEDPFRKINLKIAPETIFFAHCSNIQAWVECDYDTRLLHSNLAFPLLKKLAEAGDSIAKKAFKREIAKRFEKGSENTRTFLINGGYLDYLTQEELMSIVSEASFDMIVQNIEIAKKMRQQDLYYYSRLGPEAYSWDDNYDLLKDIEGKTPDNWTFFNDSQLHKKDLFK